MNLPVNTYATHFSRAAVVAVTVLAINHTVGVFGMNTGNHAFFESLAWVNLLLSFLLVMVFHKPLNNKLFLFAVFGFTVGMCVEIAGTATGYPFGTYYYTSNFGWRMLGVPIIIGVNWVLLSYVLGVVTAYSVKSFWPAVILASVGMMLVDLLLEPFAIRHGYWVWQNGTPPLQNYISWMFVSLPIQYVFKKLMPCTNNPVALLYLIILLLFLLSDLLIKLAM
jgi:putative membrane protein